jgi:hypothetical protein
MENLEDGRPMEYLEDGRPIDPVLIKNALISIEKEGVHGHHLLSLMEIFGASELECQVALNIAYTKWRNMVKKKGMVNDPGIALLVVLYLKHPEEWKIKYTKDPTLETLIDHLGKTMVPMFVGRSRHSIYRWQPTELPKDHIKVLLEYLQLCVANGKQSSLDEYSEIVNSEAARRGVNIYHDSSWSPKDED